MKLKQKKKGGPSIFFSIYWKLSEKSGDLDLKYLFS